MYSKRLTQKMRRYHSKSCSKTVCNISKTHDFSTEVVLKFTQRHYTYAS